MAGRVRRAQPFQEHAAHARQSGGFARGCFDPSLKAREQGAGVGAARVGELFDVAEHVGERVRMLADHAHPRERIRHLVRRDRANVADVLRDDKVWIEAEDRVRVDLVERAPLERGQRHGVLDALAWASGEVQRGTRHHGQRCGLRRVVAFVRAGDDLVTQAEREQRLGRARKQRDDPHAGSPTRSTTCFNTSYGCAPSTRKRRPKMCAGMASIPAELAIRRFSSITAS